MMRASTCTCDTHYELAQRLAGSQGLRDCDEVGCGDGAVGEVQLSQAGVLLKASRQNVKGWMGTGERTRRGGGG